MLVLAHRGANRHAPENTVAAMARAVELGADGVELDVHRTADGHLVVRHDPDTPAGPIGELTRDAVEFVFFLPDGILRRDRCRMRKKEERRRGF